MSEFLDLINNIVSFFQNSTSVVSDLFAHSLPLWVILVLFFPLCVGIIAVIVRVLVDM